MTADPYRAKEYYQSDAIARGYDDERFLSWHGRLAHAGEARALASAASRYFKSPGTVLDLPCGTGRLFPVLLAQGLKITGADISEEMLRMARVRFENTDLVRFQKANAERLPFEDEAFDYLTSFRLMCHLPLDVQRTVLSEMLRVTRRVLVLNYHFVTLAPLYLFNRAFRKKNCSPYPLTVSKLRRHIESVPTARLLEIHKLTWYERSSALVVIQKTG